MQNRPISIFKHKYIMWSEVSNKIVYCLKKHGTDTSVPRHFKPRSEVSQDTSVPEMKCLDTLDPHFWVRNVLGSKCPGSTVSRKRTYIVVSNVNFLTVFVFVCKLWNNVASSVISLSAAFKLSSEIAQESWQVKWDQEPARFFTRQLIPQVNTKILFPRNRDAGISYCTGCGK